MTKLISYPLDLLYDWINERIGLTRSEDFRALGRVEDDRLVGVVAFTGYNGSSLQMHMAGEGPWITKHFLKEAFRYAFVTCDCKVVFGMVPSGNVQALDIDRRFGFKEIANVEGAHPDGSLHILMMRREDCRWLR